MNRTADSIYHRISVRKYEDRDVEPEKIEEILRAAMQAPSAANRQPWEFYVVRDPEKIAALANVHRYSGCAAGAPVIIVPAYRDPDGTNRWGLVDMSIATENLWLMTDSLGLGGVWIGIAPDEERMKDVEKILDMPEGLRAFALFPLGYPAEERAQQDRFEEARIHYV